MNEYVVVYLNTQSVSDHNKDPIVNVVSGIDMNDVLNHHINMDIIDDDNEITQVDSTTTTIKSNHWIVIIIQKT